MEKIPVRRLIPEQGEPSKPIGFDIRTLEEKMDGRRMEQPLHRHDFYYMLAISKGTGRHEIDFESYEISDHSIFFLRPGQVHQLDLEAGSSGYMMQFNADFYYPEVPKDQNVLRRVSTKNLCYLDEKQYGRLEALLAYIYQEHLGKRESFDEVIRAQLKTLMIELVRNRKNQLGDESAKENTSYLQERLEELLELLESHIKSTKQVSEYADMMHLSTYQLNAITKAALNKTCSELINDQIVLEAKRNLLATSAQVNQIGYHLGYEDVSYFIRFFKKQTGYSPEAFRQKFK